MITISTADKIKHSSLIRRKVLKLIVLNILSLTLSMKMVIIKDKNA